MEEKEQEEEKHHAQDYQEGFADVRTLLSWHAPGRPFRKKSKEYFLSSAMILILVEIVLFLFSQYELMLAAGALYFMSLVLSTVSPKDFHYKISTEGVMVEDRFYIWTELYDFYFKNIEKVDVLVIRTQALLPGELKMVLGNISRDHARQILVNFIPYREVMKPTFTEKAGDWLSRNFPLERTHH